MHVVERLWPGETVTILATGPSLSQEDVDYVRGKTRVVCVNDSYRLAPWADALYACDPAWWRWHQGVPGFQGPKWSIESSAWSKRCRESFADVRRLQNTGETGLETKSTGLRTGRNSGYQAVNLAVHYGASRILLLGYDMQMVEGRRHFFGNHPESGHHSPYPSFRQHFATVVKPLAQAGVTVVNCTPGSALTCFPTDALRQALPVSAEVAA